MSNPPKTEFAVWVPPASSDENGYYSHYESITEAIADQGDGSMVYETTYKPLGRFKSHTTIVKIPSPKKRTKRKK